MACAKRRHRGLDSPSDFASPNAFDDYARAATQIRYDYEIGVASSSHSWAPALPISPPQDIETAISTRLPGPPPITNRVLNREYSITEKEWLLKQNAPVLQSVAQGLTRRCVRPTSSYVFSGGRGLKIGPVFHLMTLRAQVQAQRGDLDGALQTLLDEMQVSIGLLQNAPARGNFAAASGEQLATRELWTLMPRLNARQTKRATRQLETLLARRPTYAQMLQQEKWCTQRGLLKYFQDLDWRLYLSNVISRLPAWDARVQAFALNTISKQQVFDNYTRYMDDAIARAAQPYRNEEIEPQGFDSISMYLTWPILRVQQVQGYRRAQTSLLLTALALHARKLEQGAYPSTLKALVPRYLRTVPLDPFSAKSLRYELRPVRYISDIARVPVSSSKASAQEQTKPRIEYSNWPYTLSSVGANGKDDGGQPIERTGETSSLRARYGISINSDAKGDIVAGVNTR